jgi:hypothetical protein
MRQAADEKGVHECHKEVPQQVDRPRTAGHGVRQQGNHRSERSVGIEHALYFELVLQSLPHTLPILRGWRQSAAAIATKG